MPKTMNYWLEKWLAEVLLWRQAALSQLEDACHLEDEHEPGDSDSQQPVE